jgi:ribosomal protein S18 acetylase RimI-like enzyme
MSASLKMTTGGDFDGLPVADVSLEWHREVSDALREELLQHWVRVTNAGGAVGFIPPVGRDDVAATADHAFDRVEQRLDDLLVAHSGTSVAGWLLLESDARTHAVHWRTVKRLQVEPFAQRRGIGSALMHEARRFSSEVLGLEFLVLTVRSGTGASELYERLGYHVIGRIRSALRIAPNDDRDEIMMRLDLP